MTTSSHGNALCVTGPLWGESTSGFSPQKGLVMQALMFPRRVASDLRHPGAHCDINIMNHHHDITQEKHTGLQVVHFTWRAKIIKCHVFIHKIFGVIFVTLVKFTIHPVIHITYSYRHPDSFSDASKFFKFNIQWKFLPRYISCIPSEIALV